MGDEPKKMVVSYLCKDGRIYLQTSSYFGQHLAVYDVDSIISEAKWLGSEKSSPFMFRHLKFSFILKSE